MTRHANATKWLAAVALVCETLGFCFILVGCFGPAWLVVEDVHQGWRLEEGIWLAKLCKNMTCKVSSRQHILAEIGREKYTSDLEDNHWTEFKVLSILAIISSLVAVSTTTIALVKKSRNYHAQILTIGGVSALSSCMFLLVPVLKTSQADSSGSYTAAWTRIVASLGVFIYFVATVIKVFAVYQSLQHRCAKKQSERLRRRRYDLVVRYLSTQSDVCDSSLSMNPTLEPAVTSSGDARTLNSDSGFDSRSTTFSGLPPYDVTSRLPSYSEVTVR